MKSYDEINEETPLDRAMKNIGVKVIKNPKYKSTMSKNDYIHHIQALDQITSTHKDAIQMVNDKKTLDDTSRKWITKAVNAIEKLDSKDSAPFEKLMKKSSGINFKEFLKLTKKK